MSLIDIAKKKGLTKYIPALEKMEKYASEHGRTGMNYWGVFDISLRSNKHRLFIFDLKNGDVQSYLCAHGSKSDTDNNGYATAFSNQVNSNESSLGLLECQETYASKKFGHALRLNGLESTNSNIRRRAIVMHKSAYVSESIAKRNGHIGRSWGCLAMSAADAAKVIPQMKGGSLINIINGYDGRGNSNGKRVT